MGDAIAYGLIKGVESKVDTVDTVVDTVNTNVGSNSDSASDSGSVHAKLKDLKNYVDFQKIYSANYYNGSPSNGVYDTLLNYTAGAGKLSRVSAFTANYSSDMTIRITLDGVAYTITSPSLTGVSAVRDSGNYIDVVSVLNFDSSCKVEVKVDNPSVSNLGMFCEYSTV